MSLRAPHRARVCPVEERQLLLSRTIGCTCAREGIFGIGGRRMGLRRTHGRFLFLRAAKSPENPSKCPGEEEHPMCERGDERRIYERVSRD